MCCYYYHWSKHNHTQPSAIFFNLWISFMLWPIGSSFSKSMPLIWLNRLSIVNIAAWCLFLLLYRWDQRSIIDHRVLLLLLLIIIKWTVAGGARCQQQQWQHIIIWHDVCAWVLFSNTRAARSGGGSTGGVGGGVRVRRNGGRVVCDTFDIMVK